MAGDVLSVLWMQMDADEIVKEEIHAKSLILLVSAVGLEPTTL
jgi:hypothetical protein